MDLEQAKAPLQDAQKKPSLLERIKDKSYQSIVEILKHDSNADFKTCTCELAMHANKVEQGRKRTANPATGEGGSKQKTKAEKDADANFGKAFVPHTIFKKWTEGRQAEHKKRLAALREKNKSPGGGDSKSDQSRSANSVTLSSAPGATK